MTFRRCCKYTAIISTAIVVGLSLSVVANANERKSLKVKDLRSLFPGTYEALVQGYSVQVVARRNGSLFGAAFNYKDNGRWWISGNRLCIAWSNWMSGKVNCGRIVRTGNWYLSKSSNGGSIKFRRN